jgi:hypothetical protein
MAKVAFHPGALFPTVGFIVTNRSLPNERALAFYNGRGTAEQHIKGQAAHQGRQACLQMDTTILHALHCKAHDLI